MIFTAPQPFANEKDHNKDTVFLAGTIDNGEAYEWRAPLAERLSPDFNVLNPRRKDWDPSWKCDKNNPEFREQVQWELDGIHYG